MDTPTERAWQSRWMLRKFLPGKKATTNDARINSSGFIRLRLKNIQDSGG
jgi:hypothetical protein